MSDPTPAAPDPQPRVCSNCGAVLGPKETGHFVPPSVGESGFYYCRGAAPDQAEGPQPDDIAELRALADKFERETQVFLGYRNAERADLLRRTADELARLRAREIL